MRIKFREVTICVLLVPAIVFGVELNLNPDPSLRLVECTVDPDVLRYTEPNGVEYIHVGQVCRETIELRWAYEGLKYPDRGFYAACREVAVTGSGWFGPTIRYFYDLETGSPVKTTIREGEGVTAVEVVGRLAVTRFNNAEECDNRRRQYVARATDLIEGELRNLAYYHCEALAGKSKELERMSWFDYSRNEAANYIHENNRDAVDLVQIIHDDPRSAHPTDLGRPPVSIYRLVGAFGDGFPGFSVFRIGEARCTIEARSSVILRVK